MTSANLKAIMPAAKQSVLDTYFAHMTVLLPQYGITTPKRQAAFIAQTAHESGGFMYTEEFASGEAYEGRKALGNTQPGDGKKFKGRGLIMITGRLNYSQVSKFIFGNEHTLLDHPELLKQPLYAIQSAIWFWNTHNLNELADKCGLDKAGLQAYEALTRRINGGVNGLKDRTDYLTRAYKTLGLVA